MRREVEGETDWPVFWLLVLAGVIGAAQIGKVPPAIPILRAELDLSLSKAGWILSIFSLIGAVTGMAVGAAGDRFGHRNIIVGGLLLAAAASAGGALSGDAFGLLVSRLFEGFGFVAAVVAVPSLLVRAVKPADRGLAFGIWGGYMPAGTALMIGFAPSLMASVGWRGMWLLNAGLLTGCASLLLYGARAYALPPRPGRAASMWRGVRQTATRRGPLALAASFALYTFIFLTVFGFLPTLLIDTMGYSLAAAAAWTAFAVASNVGGNLLGGLGLHHGVPRWVLMAFAFAVMGLGVVIVYTAAVPAEGRLAAAVLVSFVGGMIPAVCIAGSAVHAPTPALIGTTNGLLMQASQLGQTIGPVATAAFVTAAGGWQVAPILLVAIGVAGVGAALLVGRVERGSLALAN